MTGGGGGLDQNWVSSAATWISLLVLLMYLISCAPLCSYSFLYTTDKKCHQIKIKIKMYCVSFFFFTATLVGCGGPGSQDAEAGESRV